MTRKPDIVLRNGSIYDGTGGSPFDGDIAITDGFISQVGGQIPAGREEIDAAGMIVTPGFVDIHTHYDGQVTWENQLKPSSNHGVTTVVLGNCGVGFAPIRPHQRELAKKLMEGVEDIPEVVMTEGLPWNWETFPEYLDALDQRQADIDFAAQIPHSPLRVYVMGERGANLEMPTAEDLSEMRRLTAEAIRAGAIGVSTSRHVAHRFRDGRLAPSVPAGEEEVLALAAGLRDAGAGVFQLLPSYEIDSPAQARLHRKIAEVSGRQVSFTLAQSPTEPDGWRFMLNELSAANAAGLRIQAQVLPRPSAVMLGLDLSLNPFGLNPSYKAIAELPLARKVEIMRDPAFRARLIAEEPDDPNPFFRYLISEIEMLFVLGDPPNYNPPLENSLGRIAQREGRPVREVIYDALLQRDGAEILYRPLGGAVGERFHGPVEGLVKHEHTLIALGDGGAHYSMICDAAYPTYMLTYWVRDAPEDRALDLPWLIRKLAHDPAVAVGLEDRGLIAPGFKADLNVIDMQRLRLHAPLTKRDLPAGARRLEQRADGYAATIVSGKIVYREGEATGALPGRLVRGPRGIPGQFQNSLAVAGAA
jgi:N-acyl-D-aspartate/D-glutamate deacylase